MATAGGSSSSDTSIEIRGMEMDSSHQAIDVEEEHNSTKAAHQEAKEAAIRDMPAPVGYRRVKLPAKSATRSIVYDHGVRFEQDVDDPDPKKQLWFCACSPSCRAASANNQGGISCQITQTGNITRHLKNHGIESDKTRKTSATKATHATTVSKAKQTVKDSGDPGRLMMLLFVRVFIIAHLLAFSLSDSKHVRAFLDVCGDDLFPQTKMYPTMIKHFVVELYKATISRFSHALLSAVTGAGGPLLHANFDLWTSKTSNEKYVGLRLFWCTANFAIESALVAVKLFNPSADLSDSLQLSGALLLWVEDVLNELGLSPRCLFSTVTDAESDVKRLCLKVPKSEWEWCFPHMLNCALVEAFGTTASRVACKNLQAREIMDAVKKVAEHLNKSNLMKVMYEDIQHLMFGKATKLLNAVPHRWISICKVLEEVLRNWAALEEHYVKKERGAAFPLATYKTEIEELYSLMKPIAVLMQESQQTGVPTGLNTFLALVMLRCSTLDASKPLLITVPCKALAEEAGTTITTTVDRPAENLKPVTANTRQMLLVAVNKRFFDKRYNRAVVSDPPPGYVFEMAACMSPCFVQLMWLSAVCSSQKEAQCVGKLIKDKVVDLMVSMAQGMGEEPVKEPEGDGGKSTAPREKRKLGPFAAVASPNKKSNEATKRLLASGVFGGSSSSKTDKKWPAVLTMREVCQHEFDRFQQRFEGACVDDYPVGDLLEFWTKEGRSLYPNMARAARVLLSVPASSAVLERDFSTAGRLITESRSKLDAAYAEMVLFLNGNQEYIPQEVPALSTEQALQAVLKRLSEPRPEIERLSSADAEQDNDFDEYAVEMSD